MGVDTTKRLFFERGLHVFNDEGNHAVGEIGRQFQMVSPELTLAIFSCGSSEDLAGTSVDEDLSGMRKERPLLNMVVGDELEGVVLSVDGGFIVNRAIFEGEDCFCGDLYRRGRPGCYLHKQRSGRPGEINSRKP